MQTTISNSSFFRKALEFEKICAEMFEDKGIKVDSCIRLTNGDEVDFVLTSKNGTKSAVEIKFYITRKPNKIMLEKAISKIKRKSQMLNIENQVLIIGVPLDTRIKIDLTEKHKVHILDGNNILYLIENNALLLSKFNNLINDIPTEVQDDLKAEAFDLNILFNDKANTIYFEGETKINQGDMMWNELKAISPGRASFDQYEKVCERILKYLFDENLTGWHQQLRTDDELNRYDLICRVKRGNEFWEFLVNEFHSRYIVFEFKNYRDEIQQTQVYTTEKYLFQKALRNVSFIISRKGLSNNAINATKGILRESGKLIISICDDDLYKLLQLKESGDEPADILFELVDDTLLKLSK